MTPIWSNLTSILKNCYNCYIPSYLLSTTQVFFPITALTRPSNQRFNLVEKTPPKDQPWPQAEGISHCVLITDPATTYAWVQHVADVSQLKISITVAVSHGNGLEVWKLPNLSPQQLKKLNRPNINNSPWIQKRGDAQPTAVPKIREKRQEAMSYRSRDPGADAVAGRAEM